MPPVLLSGQTARQLSKSTQSYCNETISERRAANSNCSRMLDHQMNDVVLAPLGAVWRRD